MILSIQSHVCYGYVGNRVATFILQRLGFDVITLNTVQFSNHTGYGGFAGDIFDPASLRQILDHLDQSRKLRECKALLTGYLGAPETADLAVYAHHLLKKNPSTLYTCDPVMGDVGRGFFVKEGIPEKFKKDVIPCADIITPNLFELEALSNTKVNTLDDLKRAVLSLNRQTVIVTSVMLNPLDPAQIYMLLYQNEKFTLIGAPKFDMPIPPNGAGDGVSALFLGYVLKGNDYQKAFLQTNTALHFIFRETFARGQRELALIQSQDEWSQGKILFEGSEI